MIKAEDLRCGNIVEYRIGEDEWEELTINAEHILWCQQDAETKSKIANFNIVHRPIKLTPEFLERAGFEKKPVGEMDVWIIPIPGQLIGKPNYMVWNGTEDKKIWRFGFLAPNEFLHAPLQYVHQLQNLYHSLTGNELEIKEPQPA